MNTSGTTDTREVLPQSVLQEQPKKQRAGLHDCCFYYTQRWNMQQCWSHHLLQTSCRVRYHVVDWGKGSLTTALGTLAFTWSPYPAYRAADTNRRSSQISCSWRLAHQLLPVSVEKSLLPVRQGSEWLSWRTGAQGERQATTLLLFPTVTLVYTHKTRHTQLLVAPVWKSWEEKCVNVSSYALCWVWAVGWVYHQRPVCAAGRWAASGVCW